MSSLDIALAQLSTLSTEDLLKLAEQAKKKEVEQKVVSIPEYELFKMDKGVFEEAKVIDISEFTFGFGHPFVRVVYKETTLMVFDLSKCSNEYLLFLIYGNGMSIDKYHPNIVTVSLRRLV